MKRFLLAGLGLAASVLVPVLLPAQQLIQLPRSTATTGLNDSTLFFCSDSVRPLSRTRACVLPEIRKQIGVGLVADSVRLGARNGATATSQSAHDSSTKIATTLYVDRAASAAPHALLADTVTAGARNGATATSQTAHDSSTKIATTLYVDRAKAIADSAVAAGRATILTTARTIGGVSFNGSANTTVSSATGGFTVSGGSLTTARDSITTGSALVLTATNDSVLGAPVWGSGQTFPTIATGTTAGIGTGAVAGEAIRLVLTLDTRADQYAALFAPTFNSSATTSGTGLYVQGATANSSFTMTSAYGLYVDDWTKGASSTITTQYGLYVASQTKGGTKYGIYTNNGKNRLGDTLVLATAPAEAGTKDAVCRDASTGVLYINSGVATCTVSSARYKREIRPLSCKDARRMVDHLKPVTYVEDESGRRALGIVAEQADSVDHRLAARNNQGVVQGTNYEEVFTALLRERQCVHRADP